MNYLESFIAYLQLERNYSQHTITAYQADLNRFFEYVLREYDEENVLLLNYSMIRSWIVELVVEGLSNRSINRKIASLKAFYKFLLKTHQLEASPLAKHKALKEDKKVQIPFSEKELMEMLDDALYEDGFEGKRDQLIVELFYFTGIRKSELINLSVESVDFYANTLKVLGKRNKERYVPLSEKIIKNIRGYLILRSDIAQNDGGNYLFLTKVGGKMYDTLVYRLINSYIGKVSVKVKKSPHMLRHTFATHMLNHGADLNAVKELLGHSSLASTQVYTHTSISELKKVYNSSHPRNKK